MEQQICNIQWSCQQLLNRVTILMDDARWQEVAACYTEDALLFRPSDPDNGIQGRDAILASFHARPPRTTCHILANSIFEVRTPELVNATSRVWLMTGEPTHSHPVKADGALLAGSFSDELVCVGGNWLIRRRQGSMELRYDYRQ